MVKTRLGNRRSIKEQLSYIYCTHGLRNTKLLLGGSTISYTEDINSSLPEVLQDGTYSYVYGLGGLISQTDVSGNQQYFLGNGLGSTEKLTDGSGSVVATYKYDIFGAVRASTGSGSAEYRFTGQQDDATLGYTYLRARYYDPQTGRFLSKDPFPGLLTNPASQHYYGYAQNNPVNWKDPSGKFLPLVLVGAFIVANPEIVVGAFALVSLSWTAYTRTHQDDIQAVGESCGIAIQGAVDNVFAFNPYGSRGGPAHRERIEDRIRELEALGLRHVGGGSKKEEVIKIDGGKKSFRRPDITMEDPANGNEPYRENVGRTTPTGEPVQREQDALDDIQGQTGERPGFTGF